MEMNSNQRRQLRDALLSCSYMDTPQGRQQIMSDMKKDYREIKFRSSQDPVIEVAGIIDMCLEFGGESCLKGLLTVLEGYQGAGSDKMKAVWAVWNEIVSRPVPAQLRSSNVGEWRSSAIGMGTARPEADFSQVGRELHWDRQFVVDEFVDIVMARSGKEDIRVLAIPAPPEAGADSLVQRFEAICIELTRSAGMAVRIVPVRLQLTDSLVQYQIVVRILLLLASKIELCKRSIRDVCDQINKEWGPREARKDLSPDSLADRLSSSLQESASECRPVILLHGFDDRVSEQVRWWLINTWLESYHSELQGIVVVLAGTPKLGLEDLSQPPHMVCLDPLPQMSARDLWEWAYKGHNLTWLTQELVATYNRERIHGSPLKFYEAIEAFKALAQFAPEEKLRELLAKQLES